MQNFARSIRILIHQPRYAVLAVLTLPTGIGANSAMFRLLDAVYFRPLPISEPNRLVDLALVSPGNRFSKLSYEEFRDIEGRTIGSMNVVSPRVPTSPVNGLPVIRRRAPRDR